MLLVEGVLLAAPVALEADVAPVGSLDALLMPLDAVLMSLDVATLADGVVVVLLTLVLGLDAVELLPQPARAARLSVPARARETADLFTVMAFLGVDIGSTA